MSILERIPGPLNKFSRWGAEGPDVASASTCNIWSDHLKLRHITGGTNIDSFGTAPYAGAWQVLLFDGAPTLVQSANLNVNGGGSDVNAAAGDMAFVYADTTTQMDVFVVRKSGRQIIGVPTEMTAKDFGAGAAVSNTWSSIPSWATEITIGFKDFSTDGVSPPRIRLGDSGGIEDTGYVGVSTQTSGSGTSSAGFTAGFDILSDNAAYVLNGHATIRLNVLSSNTWTLTGQFGITTGGTGNILIAGSKPLSGTLDKLILTTVNGTDSINAGVVNVNYR